MKTLPLGDHPCTTDGRYHLPLPVLRMSREESLSAGAGTMALARAPWGYAAQGSHGAQGWEVLSRAE